MKSEAVNLKVSPHIGYKIVSQLSPTNDNRVFIIFGQFSLLLCRFFIYSETSSIDGFAIQAPCILKIEVIELNIYSTCLRITALASATVVSIYVTSFNLINFQISPYLDGPYFGASGLRVHLKDHLFELRPRLNIKGRRR